MAHPNGQAHEQSTSEDRIAELLAAYDDALADDCQIEISIPLDEHDPNVVAEIEDLVSKARAIRRVHKALLATGTPVRDSTHADAEAATSAPLDALRPDEKLTEPAELPKTLGRFEILRELGSGGSGVVFLARDPVLGRFVALKVPRPETLFSKDLRRRFLREAQAAARLTHPNLLPVYEVGEAGSVCYISAAFCEGPDLARWLVQQAAPVSAAAAARLVAQLADGMAYAHGEGVIHRDLKPANVLLEALPAEGTGGTTEANDLSRFRPRITDFGLAKLETGEAIQTRTGAMLGTLPYLAPEQADATRGPIGPSTDVYGLGVILYELLAGRRPFRGPSETETLRQVLNDPPAAPRGVRTEVPRDLEAICLKCLEKNPCKRYATAAGLAADLRRFLGGQPTLARPLSRTQRLFNWARRRPALASLVGVSVVAALVIVALATAYVEQQRSARQTAEQLGADAAASAERAGQFMYASQVRQAHEWIEQGEIDRAEPLLQEYESGSKFASLRSIDWYHAKRQLRAERLNIDSGHGEVYTVVFSLNGREVISGGQDGSIKYWDSASGELLRSFAAHQSCVNMLALTPDGQLLVSASCDHTIKLWRPTTLELIATLSENRDEVLCLAISPDGRLLAAGGRDGIARVWDLASLQVIHELNTHCPRLDTLLWRADGRALVVMTPKCASLWNLEANRILGTVANVDAGAISPGNSICYLGQSNGEFIKLSPDFSTRQSTKLGSLIGFPRAEAFSRDGAWFATGSDQCVVHLWSGIEQSHARALSGHTARVQAIAFHPRGVLIATGSFDGTVKLWDRFESESIPRLSSVYFDNSYSMGWFRLEGVAISSDFQYVAIRTGETEVLVSNLASGRPIETIDVSPNVLTGLNFLDEANFLFGICQDEEWIGCWDVGRDKPSDKIRVRSPKASEPLRDLNHVELSGNAHCVILADPRRVAIANVGDEAVWFEQSRQKSPFLPGAMIRWSPDGQTYGVSMGSNQPSWLVDLEARRQTLCNWEGMLAVSTGARLAAFPSTTALRIIEPETSREVCVLNHGAATVSAAFSPDSRTIATGTDDRRVYLWNVATGEQTARFEPRAEIRKLQFSADGRKLAGVALTPENEGICHGQIRIFVWEGSE